MTNYSSCRRLSRSTTIGAEKSSSAMDYAVADGGERPSGVVGTQWVQGEIQPRLGADAVDLAGDDRLAGQAAAEFEQRELGRRRAGIDGQDAAAIYPAARLR